MLRRFLIGLFSDYRECPACRGRHLFQLDRMVKYEAMGLDHLDMTFRIEKAFGFKWDLNGDADVKRLWAIRANQDIEDDCTAGDVHTFVCLRLRELGREVPHDSWRQLQEIIVKVTRCEVEDVRPESYLKKDLGFH